MFKNVCMASVGQRILLTLWVGGLWTAGYIVAPMLFHVLDDRRLAGELAGEIFGVMSYVGLACGIVLLIGLIYQAGRDVLRAWQFWALVAMLALVSIGEFILQPMIYTLKAATPGGFVEGSGAAARFGILHGISSLLFLATSLLGLALVAFGFNRNNTD